MRTGGILTAERLEADETDDRPDAVSASRLDAVRVVQWGLVAVTVTFALVMAWRTRWVSDDGFIHLRVVQQIINDNGPVFNVGERVEASTSPLWVALLVVASPFTAAALPWKAVLLGMACTGVGVAAAQRAAVWLGRPVGEPDRSGAAGDTASRPLVLPLGILVVLALRPFWEFSTSGLETGLVFAWLGLSMWWCARRTTLSAPPPRGQEIAGAVMVGLGWLVRPDLALFSVAFGGVLLAAVWPRGWRLRLGFLAAMAALPLAYQIFRMGYYAMVVPNTALAKEAGQAQWELGWKYLDDLVAPYWLGLPVILLVGLIGAQALGDVQRGWSLRAAARLAPVVASLLHGLYVVRAGGDFMHARLLLPAVFGLVAPVGVPMSWKPLRAVRPVRLVGVAAVAAVVLVWAGVCSTSLRREEFMEMPDGEVIPVSDDWFIMDERAFYRDRWNIDPPVRADMAFPWGAPTGSPVPGYATFTPPDVFDPPLRAELRPGFPTASAQAADAVGVPSYAWGPGVFVMDNVSLAQPVGSHFDEPTLERPGHQKFIPLVWQLADVTDAPVVLDGAGQPVVPPEELEAVRQALQCGELGDYLEDIREPLTVSRFFGNIWDSVGNTLFRIPVDAEEAESELCD